MAALWGTLAYARDRKQCMCPTETIGGHSGGQDIITQQSEHSSPRSHLSNQSIIKAEHYGCAKTDSRLKYCHLNRRSCWLDLQVSEMREVSDESNVWGKIVRDLCLSLDFKVCRNRIVEVWFLEIKREKVI